MRTPARVRLFGYPPASATLDLRPRPRRWRVGGAARIAATTLVLAPAAALVPPHAPWLLGVLGVGGFLARRRFTERFTVVGVEGACPSCGTPLRTAGGRLHTPYRISCDTCHHELALEVDPPAA